MRDFRQQGKKKKLPQNKPSRDESSLPRCAARPWLIC